MHVFFEMNTRIILCIPKNESRFHWHHITLTGYLNGRTRNPIIWSAYSCSYQLEWIIPLTTWPL